MHWLQARVAKHRLTRKPVHCTEQRAKGSPVVGRSAPGSERSLSDFRFSRAKNNDRFHVDRVGRQPSMNFARWHCRILRKVCFLLWWKSPSFGSLATSGGVTKKMLFSPAEGPVSGFPAPWVVRPVAGPTRCKMKLISCCSGEGLLGCSKGSDFALQSYSEI